MHSIELSRAFQTALGVLLTNSAIAKGFIAGEIQVGQLHEALTDADSDGLRRLVSGQPDRVVAVADLLTSRRRRRVVASLAATVRMLGEEFENVWNEYLRGDAPRSVLSVPMEALAFGNWVLSRLERGSVPFQLLTYELCRNDIAQRLRSSPIGAVQAGSAVMQERSRLRLSRYARLERFEWAVDEAMARLRRTGKILAEPQGGPVHLVFHPLPGRVATVGVTKVSAAMSSMLERSTTGSALHELVSLVPTQMHAHLRSTLEKLVAIHVLDLIG